MGDFSASFDTSIKGPNTIGVSKQRLDKILNAAERNERGGRSGGGRNRNNFRGNNRNRSNRNRDGGHRSGGQRD